MRESLGHFKILELLGEGGMGTVYKAVDTRDGRSVALKILSHQSLLDEEIKRRFRREAEAGARLVNPNIVAIYEVGDVEGEHFISMELVEGKTLHQMLKEGPASPAEVVRIGIAVGDALREAHKSGIVHRDIKAANIMVTTGGQVKVMDFGLAKIQNASMLTREGEMLGTVTYMSPEQATGEAVDHRTDIFSLGVVLYELLTGKLPFGDQYDMAVVYSILNVEPAGIRESHPDVPEALETIILKALRKDLQHRYQHVEELLGDLRRMKAFLEGKRDIMPSGVELVAGAELGDAARSAEHLTAAGHGAFEARFSGRDDQLEGLKALLRKADGGEGQTVFIAGEAGIGKTKLVSELEKYARTIKIRPINARCAFREGSVPYRPFVEIVRDLFTARGLNTAGEREEYFRGREPGLLPHLPAIQLFLNVQSGESAPLWSKDQLWEALLRLIQAISRERTVLFFIDDLHWADDETLRLLQYLARNTRQMPVMLIGTYRPEDLVAGSGRVHTLLEVEPEMLREGCLTVLRLERLKETDINRMISSLFHNAEFGKALVESVYRESEGNPLFVMEIMKLLKMEEVIRSEAGIYRLRSDFEAFSMPSRIQDIVLRRVGRLQRSEREVLEIGAVEGEIFHSDTISRCLDTNRLTILRMLQALERDYHIIHAQGKVYRFDHAKIRDALYESITPELRTEYHLMVGKFLADAYGDDEHIAPNIAHHFLESGERVRAFPFLVTEAGHARKLFANLEAIQAYEQALQICRECRRSELDPMQRDIILEGLGDVCSFIGNHERALENYETLLSGGDLASIKRAEVLQKVGQVHLNKGDNEKALAVLADADRALATAATDAGEAPEGIVVRGKSAILRARIYKSRGEYQNAIDLIDKGLGYLGDRGNLHERADALNDLGNIFEDRSEYKSAEEVFRRSLSLREEIADKKGIAVTYNNLANIFCAQGDYANAAAMFKKSLDLMKQIGFRVGIAGTSNNLGTIYQDQGRYRESIDLYKRCLQIREEIGDRPGIAMSYGNLGYAYLDLGEYAVAGEYLEKSVRLQEEIGMKTLLSATIAWLGLAHAGLGEIDRGIELASRALTMASGMHQKWYEGIAQRSLGVILMEKGKTLSPGEERERLLDESLRSIEASLRIFDEGKFEFESGRSSLELARLHLLRGETCSFERCRERAGDVFQKLGAFGQLDRVNGLLATH
jgi:tetratricopeptide (TPR) repeat protein